MKKIKFSVLMATYIADDPQQLYDAIDSNTIKQMLKPDEFVLVVDGPINPDLENVIRIKKEMCELIGVTFIVVRVESNSGLANALNLGIQQCGYEWIARADADDISTEDRFEVQVNQINKNNDVDVHFSYQAEFTNSPDEITTIKECPLEHEEIKKALSRRCVVSHPSIMYRKSIVNEVGGYRTDVGYFEDYDLHFRLLAAGGVYAAYPKALVLVRISEAQLLRRGGLKYAFKEFNARRRLFLNKNITFVNFIFFAPLYFIFRITPPWVKKYLYKSVRRSSQNSC